MFSQLLASRPARQRSAAGVVASVTVHVLVFGAAVYATLGARPVAERPLQQNVMYVPPEAPKPPEVRHIAPPAAPTVPASGPPVVSVPIDVPDKLPPIPPVIGDQLPLPPSTRFVPGGTATPPLAPTVEPGGTYLASQVDQEVAIEKGSPLPAFPSDLRALGIEGDARFRFVVDTLGRVELSTVEQLGSTRPAFAMAVRQTLPRMRFRPARVDGRPVRQLVEFPIVFRITR